MDRAAAEAFARPRSRLNWLDATTTLEHFALVTFDVDTGAAGWFLRPDGRLGRYPVWHDRLRLRVGVARRVRYDVFESLGLVEPGAAPHSVLLQRATEFDVLLPPRRA